jgi:hypothetical protein
MSEHLPAIQSRAYCSCGCGLRSQHANMAGYPHPGFGGVRLTRDGECVYPWGEDTTFDDEADRICREYEDVAAGDPEHDWRLRIDGPLSDYTYQRQGEALWVLVEQGVGFA